MITQSQEVVLDLTDAILRTIVYADIFNYALTAQEVHRYLIGQAATPESITSALHENFTPEVLQQIGDYYILPGRASNIALRTHNEKNSSRLWPLALYYGHLIARLPFVRMVAVTGSLAMNNADENGDIDYLIVTANERLWLCRLFVLFIVRLAKRRGINLCPNYFVSERALAFSEHNLYAAHEFAQMIPLTGLAVYQRMQILNTWVTDYLPNMEGLPARAPQFIQTDSPLRWRTWLEALLITRPFNWLERWEMHRKIRKLPGQRAINPEVHFSADVCKGHFDQHGQRTRQNLAERLQHVMMESKS